MSEVLIIIPTYNERENVSALIDQIFALPPDVHILVVDDASPDGTADAVREKQKFHGEEKLKLVVREQGKAGRGSACLHGFKYARDHGYQIAIEMDADLSHDPRDIPRLLQKIPEADVVIGSKHIPNGKMVGCPWDRVLLSEKANFYARMSLQLPVKDYTSGYRCYNRKALDVIPEITIEGKGFTVIPQMSYQLHQRGIKQVEIPIIFIDRRSGKSNANIKELIESFFGILRIRSHSLYKHAAQTLKFGMTGVINTLLDFGLLALFIEVFHLPLRIAVVASGAIAVTNAFFMHKHWTFKCDRSEYLKQYAQFLMVYGSSFVINVAVTLFLAEQIGLWYLFARAVAIPLGAIWNYLWMHFGVFRR